MEIIQPTRRPNMSQCRSRAQDTRSLNSLDSVCKTTTRHGLSGSYWSTCRSSTRTLRSSSTKTELGTSRIHRADSCTTTSSGPLSCRSTSKRRSSLSGTGRTCVATSCGPSWTCSSTSTPTSSSSASSASTTALRGGPGTPGARRGGTRVSSMAASSERWRRTAPEPRHD